MLNYHLPNAPSKAAYSMSFMSVKEDKITRKDPFDYEMGLTTVNSMLCSLGFNEHDKDIKYTQNIFHV